MDDYGDLLVVTRFRNARLDDAMRLAGMSQRSLGRAVGVSAHVVGTLLRLQSSPRTRLGAYSETAAAIAAYLGMTPDELFPDELYRLAMHLPNRMYKTYRAVEFMPLLEAYNQKLLPSAGDGGIGDVERALSPPLLKNAVRSLTPREEKVINARFGLGDDEAVTLGAVANEFCTTRERIRQIEAKALRKLRHPSRKIVPAVIERDEPEEPPAPVDEPLPPEPIPDTRDPVEMRAWALKRLG